MPSETLSRYYRTLEYSDSVTRLGESRRLLAYRFPFPYVDHPRNSVYEVAYGDSLATIAFKVYPDLGDSYAEFSTSRLYWAIADFQPIPIIDPFVQLQEGQRLIIPAFELLRNQIIGG
jgi:hypothetical protein